MKTNKKSKIKINPLTVAAYAIYLISFLWLFKFIKKKTFERRKHSAIKKADMLHAQNGEKYFVIQIEREFIVGTRRELRNINKRGTKILKRMTKSNLLNFDFRNAIVYQSKNE